MLKSLLSTSNNLYRVSCPLRRNLLSFQIFRASISTNTAINKALRRSQYRGDKVERWSSEPTVDGERGSHGRPYKVNRTRRPNHQQRQDVRDIEQHTRINERYRAPPHARVTRRVPKRLKTFAQDAVTRGPTTSETLREARYDYTRKAGGNRVARRAAQFGHDIEPSPGPGQAVVSGRRQPLRQRLRRNEELDLPGRGSRGPSTSHDEVGEATCELSLPEDLRDEHRSRTPGGPFTMGRQALDDTGSSDSRGTKGWRREHPQNNDQAARYRESDAPLSMPYTTPASEFLYGTSVVVAALLSSRRKLYKLYIYDGDNREIRDQDIKIRKMALERNIVVDRVKGDWLRMMDKMSGGRPHNGYILEASPLPRLPVIGLLPVDRRKAPLGVVLDHQSREDEEINGKDTNIRYEVGFSRYPFVLLLDGILDPGNLGAILRTAFFLGVDVVAVANRSSAPISPVALKASAGATETLPLISVNQPGSFLDNCKKNGWTIYAAASPGSHKRPNPNKYLSSSALGSPVQEHPCVLVLGGEGEGLRWDIHRKASFDVGIEGQRVGQGRVDSLNVSVAAGLLCEAFLRKPSNVDNTVSGTSDVSVHNIDPQRDAGNVLF